MPSTAPFAITSAADLEPAHGHRPRPAQSDIRNDVADAVTLGYRGHDAVLRFLAYQFLREERRRKQPQPALPIVPGFDPPGLWFHSIDLGNGQVTRGLNHSFRLRGMADMVFKSGVAGKSVLDIGAWDGFFSFEAEKRGAARVLATDHPCWSGSAWGRSKASTTFTRSGSRASKARTSTCGISRGRDTVGSTSFCSLA